MANRNGMGPFNQGPLTGRGRGTCSPNSNAATKLGVGLGMGMLAWGCRRGMGRQGFRSRGFFNMGRSKNAGFQDNPESLDEYKSYLEEELALVNKQFDTKDND